jgi:hypothetical protein
MQSGFFFMFFSCVCPSRIIPFNRYNCTGNLLDTRQVTKGTSRSYSTGTWYRHYDKGFAHSLLTRMCGPVAGLRSPLRSVERGSHFLLFNNSNVRTIIVVRSHACLPNDFCITERRSKSRFVRNIHPVRKAIQKLNKSIWGLEITVKCMLHEKSRNQFQ